MPHKDPEVRASYHRAYRAQHETHLKELDRQYREANKETLQAAKILDYQVNKEAYKARAKASRERRADAIKAQRSTQEFRDKRNAARRAAYVPKPRVLLTPEERLQRKRAHYAQNRQHYQQRFAAYYKDNKDKWPGYWNRKPYWRHKFERSLSKAYSKDADIIDLSSIRDFYRQVFTQTDAVCDYCRGRFPIKEIIVEHKEPYVLGGAHAVSNCAVSCNPCNLRKGTTPYATWISFAVTEKVV